jgi:hypothetical protein
MEMCYQNILTIGSKRAFSKAGECFGMPTEILFLQVIKKIFMKPIFPLAIVALIAFACQPKAPEQAAQPPQPVYPTLPMEMLNTLMASCDYIDLIMYNPQFSMSQNDQASVQGSIQQITLQAPLHNASNQPVGHIFYQSKGETILEADLYLGAGGSYFIFYQAGKPAFANAMTPTGVNFYGNILSRLQGGGQ